MLALSKGDLTDVKEAYPALRERFAKVGLRLRLISAATREGLEELCNDLYRIARGEVRDEDRPPPDEIEPVKKKKKAAPVKAAKKKKAAPVKAAKKQTVTGRTSMRKSRKPVKKRPGGEEAAPVVKKKKKRPVAKAKATAKKKPVAKAKAKKKVITRAPSARRR